MKWWKSQPYWFFFSFHTMWFFLFFFENRINYSYEMKLIKNLHFPKRKNENIFGWKKEPHMIYRNFRLTNVRDFCIIIIGCNRIHIWYMLYEIRRNFDMILFFLMQCRVTFEFFLQTQVIAFLTFFSTIWIYRKLNILNFLRIFTSALHYL